MKLSGCRTVPPGQVRIPAYTKTPTQSISQTPEIIGLSVGLTGTYNIN